MLKERVLTPELMDELTTAPAELHIALNALNRFHQLTRTADIFVREILSRCQCYDLTKPLRILDLGAGDGRVLLSVSRELSKHRIKVEPIALDFNPGSLRFAAELFGSQALPLEIACRNVEQGFSDLHPHVVISSLFFHHLGSDLQRRLIDEAVLRCHSDIFIDDLERSKAGYFATWLATRLLSRSKMVHADGLLSVQAACSFEEFRELFAGLPQGAGKVQRRFPFRLLGSGLARSLQCR